MRTLTVCSGLICFAAMALVAGFPAAADADTARVSPVVLQENEQIIRDHLIILVDVSGSIGNRSRFEYGKALVERFTAAMPNGYYQSGIKSFAGVHRSEWLQVKLGSFNRATMTEGAASTKPLGATTPLTRAIYNQRNELSGKGGRGALLIFSDGMVRDPQAVLQACRDLRTEYGGELCVFTVQMGDSASGKRLLQDMAAVNGCGTYYDGASLENSAAMNSMVRDIFFGPREVARQAAAPAPSTPVPVPLNLENVHFEHDIDVVHSMYNAQLDEVAATMRNEPRMRLRLHGHTDSNGTNVYNQALSERRVNAVAAALAQRGVESSRLETHAHGEESPAVPNTNPRNMHTNRRVELSRID